MTESHPHSKDTGTDASIVRNLISDNGSACGIHDKPDVSFDTADFDIGFISSENITCLVIIMIDKRFDADGSRFAIVGDLLMGDADVIKIFECLRCFLKDNPRLICRVRQRDMT